MLSNSTLSSSPDEYGYRYWCSFCCKPTDKGRRLNAYRGILNGHGPQFGLHHIVKIFRDKRGSESLCDLEIEKTQKARQLCRRFASEFGLRKEINFVPLLKAHMDETPFFPCSSDWKRPLLRDEWVLIEERTGKRYKTFFGEDGSQNRSERTRFTLSAFTHYSFHITSGSLVLCGFEGSLADGSYRLKSPTIHSASESFGETDRGIRGILNVFQNHKCNALCENFMKPNILDLLPRAEIPMACTSGCSGNLDYLLSNGRLRGSQFGSVRMRDRLMPNAPPPYEE